MKFNFEDLCWLFRDAARYFPVNSERCRQIQSFRVLQEDYAAELATSNFGASICDKGKPYFYSRQWEASGYREDSITAEFPVLTAMEVFESGMRKEPFTTGNYSLKFELAVVDRYTPDKTTCKGCEARVIDELYRDTQELLNMVLAFIGESSVYVLNSDRSIIANPTVMKLWDESAQIAGYEASHPIGSLLQSKNQRAPLKRVFMPTDHFYGTMVVLEVDLLDCQTPVYSPDVNKYKYDRNPRLIEGCC